MIPGQCAMLRIDGLLGIAYRWFGRSETCRVPTPDVSGRFIT
jgi:predicted DCC family thiol-disulfide oxidoreductase YuxK